MRKKNIRNSEIKPLKEAFDQMLNSYHLKSKYKQMDLISKWEEIMGAPIAKRTSKIYIKDQTLFVQLTSAPLKKELTMGKSKILDLFERAMNEKVIQDIYFL